ncbi:hypothetical protein DPMN_091349 [Dreissena polymorpha]|uniref:Fibronectin type-III domain-containing protein n=1 Tax=Dreissena polymorpha TaxID=45954 RepID=A0A9D4L0D4_DREPO|nr:hypothetical protein DPMN_091349 [Dreissena polymorpha]
MRFVFKTEYCVTQVDVLLPLRDNINLQAKHIPMFDLTMEYNLLLSAMMSIIQLSTAIVNCRHHNNVKTFAVLVFMCLTTVSAKAGPKRTRNGDYDLCHNGAISPRDPFFLLGSPIVLNCTSNWPSSNLTFLYGTNSTEVDSQYISIVNDTTITMKLPPVTNDTIREYKASMSYRCVDKQIPDKITCISNTHVKVDCNLCPNTSCDQLLDYPVAPIDFRCRILGFDTMNCSWDLAVKYTHNISVKCKYRASNSKSSLAFVSDIGDFEKCPEKRPNGCFWNVTSFTDAEVFYIALSVTNKHLNVTVHAGNDTCDTTPCYIIRKYDIAEPFPVTIHDLGFDHCWTNGTRCGRLQWWKPSNFSTHNLAFNITSTSDCDSPKTYETNFVKKYEDPPQLKSLELPDLNPFTQYNICVKARYLENNVQKGYWSEPRCISKLTPPAVPDVSPDESSLLYEIQNTENVVIYWKPLTSCEIHSQQNDTFYKISFGGQYLIESWSSEHFRRNIHISANESTIVTIETGNSVGRSKKAAILKIPQESERPKPSKLIIQYGLFTPNITNVSATIYPHEGMTGNVSHRLVVCIGSDSCKQSLEIVDMPYGVIKYEFPCKHFYGNYRYGLVTRSLDLDNGQWLDTGIDWVRCKYQLGKVPDKVQHANVSESVHGSLMVHWKLQDCLHGNVAYVPGYTVKSCTGHIDCKCQNFKETNVSADISHWTLQDLEENMPVCVWVWAQGLAGPGPETLVTPNAYVMQQSSKDASIIAGSVAAGFIPAIIVAFVMYKCQVLTKVKEWYRNKKKIDIDQIIINNHQELSPLNNSDETNGSGSSYPLNGYQRTDQMSGFTDTDGFNGDSANQMESRCTETTGLLSTGRSSENVPMEPIQDFMEMVHESRDKIHEVIEVAEEDSREEEKKCLNSENIIQIENEHSSLTDIFSKLDIQSENPSLETDFKDPPSSYRDDSPLTIKQTEQFSGSNSFHAVGYKDVRRMSLSNFEEVIDLDSDSAIGYQKTFSDSDLDSCSTSSEPIVGDDQQDTYPISNMVRKDFFSDKIEEDGCKSDCSTDKSHVSTVESPSHSAPSYMQAGLNKDFNSTNTQLLGKMSEKHDINLNDKSHMINGQVSPCEESLF